MPHTNVILYKEVDGSVPVREWISQLRERAHIRVSKKIILLKDYGHELRRPHCDFLQDGVYELRIKDNNVNIRILYFFDGQKAVILSHAFSKQESKVPQKEIDVARKRRDAYLSDRRIHSEPFGG